MPHYSYKHDNITAYGKDRMRFELGDTMTEGGPDTSYLSDEEICAALEIYPDPKDWKRAKLFLVRSVCHRFSYEVDTTIGPLSYGLRERAEMWQDLRKELENELKVSASDSCPKVHPSVLKQGHYFYTGMLRNAEARTNRTEENHVSKDRKR